MKSGGRHFEHLSCYLKTFVLTFMAFALVHY